VKTFSRQPAYQLATAEVKRYIEEHQLRGGDPLPSEAVLCQELGMSRASLREGLKALESLGIIRTRHGEGVFVAHFSFDPILHNLPYSIAAQGSSLRELLEVRCALEVGMMAQVVSRISPSDIAELRDIAGQMLQHSEQGLSFAELDRSFHATLFRCLGNAFLLSLVDLFWQVFNRLSDRLPAPDAQAQRDTAQDHLAVALMLQAGDVQALERAHRHHFQEISRRLDLMDARFTRAH
jgi:DNA-binding FadR family transcriptional regulator